MAATLCSMVCVCKPCWLGCCEGGACEGMCERGGAGEAGVAAIEETLYYKL